MRLLPRGAGMGRITLLRHTTPAVAPGTCYGRTDLPLAETFPAEAAALLPGLPTFDHLIASPLARCRRLADHIARETGAAVMVADGWTEMDFGAWETRAWSDIPRAELDAWAADFMDFRGHGGESVGQLRARVAKALNALPAGDCVIVTHMGCIKAARHLHGDPEAWDFKQAFGSATPLSSSL